MNILLKKESELIYPMSENEVLAGLTDMFNAGVPDQEYLDGDEDTQADVTNIREMLEQNNAPAIRQIETLYVFNTEWFPDEADEEEQEEYKALLESASQLIEKDTSIGSTN